MIKKQGKEFEHPGKEINIILELIINKGEQKRDTFS